MPPAVGLLRPHLWVPYLLQKALLDSQTHIPVAYRILLRVLLL